MATLAFERPQQMHTAAHLLTGGRTEDFKSFFFFSSSLYFFLLKLEVIHDFGCISSSWMQCMNV